MKLHIVWNVHVKVYSLYLLYGIFSWHLFVCSIMSFQYQLLREEIDKLKEEVKHNLPLTYSFLCVYTYLYSYIYNRILFWFLILFLMTTILINTSSKKISMFLVKIFRRGISLRKTKNWMRRYNFFFSSHKCHYYYEKIMYCE